MSHKAQKMSQEDQTVPSCVADSAGSKAASSSGESAAAADVIIILN